MEGAGGVRVPVSRHFEMIDLIRMLQLPVVVAAASGLGTINHTLLTIGALNAERLEVKGVVIAAPQETADPSVATLLPTLEAFLPATILGVLPRLDLQPGSLNSPDALSAFADLHIFEN